MTRQASNGHVSDELPRLLTGDASRDAVLEAAAHLRECEDCRQELVSAVVAHASLMSAHRFAPEIVATLHEDEEPELPSVSALPDMSSVFAEARAESTVTPISKFRTRRAVIGLAAAAAVVVGGGVTWAAVGNDSGPATQSVALTAFDKGTHPAKAQIIGSGKLTIDASKLPRLDAQHLYEVWLTNSQRSSMQSVGFVGDGNTATLTVSPKVLGEYDNIEVSLQNVNQDTYSGTSVLRGSYHD